MRPSAHLYNHSSQAFRSPQDPSAGHGISSLSAFPSALSAAFLGSPPFFLGIVGLGVTCQAGSTLHEGDLAVMFAGNPSVYTGIAVDKARWRRGWRCDRRDADGTEL